MAATISLGPASFYAKALGDHPRVFAFYASISP